MRGSSSSLDQRHHTAPVQQRGQGRGGVAQPVRAVVAYVDAKEPQSDLVGSTLLPLEALSAREAGTQQTRGAGLFIGCAQSLWAQASACALLH